MLENEPTGGPDAGDKPAAETASTRSARKAPTPPPVLFMAPEATEPPARPATASESKPPESKAAESKAPESESGEPAKPASRRKAKGAQDDAARPDDAASDAEPAGKQSRRSRSRRGTAADGPAETTRKSGKQRVVSDGPQAQQDAAAAAAASEAAPEEAKPTKRRRGKAKATEPEPAAEPDQADKADEVAADDTDEDAESGGRRRRRRGRRGRGRGKGGDETEELGGEDEAVAAEEAEDAGEEVSSVRRRRRRRRKGAADAEQPADDTVETVVKVREPRSARDEVQGVAGSTRLEAKRQRRRDGREQRRTRPPILTESEFLARREAVDRVMAIRSAGGRTQIGVLEDGVLVEHYVAQQSSNTMAGNVYLGKVQNVLPSMEAAFVDIGRGRNAVLYAGEVNWDVAGLEGRTRTIEQALRPGDSVLVQVTKDPVGHKGARLTSHITLSGRHLVYVPHGNASGISRKLPDTERKRLRDVLKKLVPEGAGVIVRTAAEGASEDDLTRDVERLQAQWATIEEKAKNAKPPTLVYEEPDLVIRVVRDIFNEDFKELIIQGDDVWDLVEPYLAHVSPELVSRLRRHTGPSDVFAETRIDEQILKALDRKVYLPSGGHLVIDRTEAMTVIDVNTGKFTGKGGNLEETVTRNNLEAAEEIVHQLRLRDIGGIIVIDFIDMVLESNRELVLRRLTECLGRDRTKHQVTEITSLGLVQMTRKRVGQGLLDAFSETCEHCRGRGVIVHVDAVEAKPAKSAAAEVKRVAAASTNGEAKVEAATEQTPAKQGDVKGEAKQGESRSGRRSGKRKAEARARAASKSDAESKPAAESEPEPESQPATDAVAAGEGQVDATAQPEAVSAAEPAPETQAQGETGVTPETAAQAEPGAETEAQPEVAPAPDGGSEAAQPAPQPDGAAEESNGHARSGEPATEDRAPV